MTEFKKYIPIVTYAIFLYLGISNIDIIGGVISNMLSIFTPLIVGIVIAFILNLLMKIIEERVYPKKTKNKFLLKKKRMISLLSTYIIAITFIVVIILFIIPQVIDSSKTLVEKLPEYGSKITDYGIKLYEELGLSNEIVMNVFGNLKSLLSGLTNFTANTLKAVLSVTMGITSGALNFFMGLVFSVYLLAQKEKFISIISRINLAFNKEKVAKYLANLAWDINHTFSRFVGGQITEAIILGTLCFIGLLIFNIPYAPLVSVLIAITSLIPIIGAFIGTVPSVLMIAMESPTKALFFVIFILILQQLEGNLIYPRVVGNAIGIDGFWVFLAIVVGGGLFGIIGMLIGVPMMAVIYSIVRNIVNYRLNKNQSEVKINI